jgi:hypothetical protein
MSETTASASESSTSAVMKPPSPPESSAQGRKAGRRRLVVGAVVVVAIVLVGVYVVEVRAHASSNNSPVVLVPVNTLYSLPASQYNGIAISPSSASVINGTFYSSYGVVLYLVNPTMFHALTQTDKVSSFQWSSGGLVGNNSVVDLNVQVPSGAWVFVFLNPSIIVTTYVGFYSDLTLTSS